MPSLIQIVQLEPELTYQTGCQIPDFYGAPGRQITPAPVCAAGGKPSTWLPPGELVEQLACAECQATSG